MLTSCMQNEKNKKHHTYHNQSILITRVLHPTNIANKFFLIRST